MCTPNVQRQYGTNLGEVIGDAISTLERNLLDPTLETPKAKMIKRKVGKKKKKRK